MVYDSGKPIESEIASVSGSYLHSSLLEPDERLVHRRQVPLSQYRRAVNFSLVTPLDTPLASKQGFYLYSSILITFLLVNGWTFNLLSPAETTLFPLLPAVTRRDQAADDDTVLS